jgi:hypothetical protein
MLNDPKEDSPCLFLHDERKEAELKHGVLPPILEKSTPHRGSNQPLLVMPHLIAVGAAGAKFREKESFSLRSSQILLQTDSSPTSLRPTAPGRVHVKLQEV